MVSKDTSTQLLKILKNFFLKKIFKKEFSSNSFFIDKIVVFSTLPLSTSRGFCDGQNDLSEESGVYA